MIRGHLGEVTFHLAALISAKSVKNIIIEPPTASLLTDIFRMQLLRFQNKTRIVYKLYRLIPSSSLKGDLT